MSLLKEISITDLSNLRIGHASDYNAQTGVTVLYFPLGAKVGCDISGGGPASRETPLTSPVTADNPINAIVLSGGSAYGLAAADGVMNYLESQNIGYNTGAALAPLVCQNGQKIAGLKTPDRSGFLDSVHELYRFMTPHDQFTGNTTIGAVITNGAFSKAELNKIASMTRCAYARCINPVATMADGDSIYAASIGDVSVDINMAGTLAAEVMAQAIQNAIHTSRIQDEEFLKYV